MRLRDAKRLEADDAVYIPHLRVVGHVVSIKPVPDPRVNMMIKVKYKARGKNAQAREVDFNYRLVQKSD